VQVVFLIKILFAVEHLPNCGKNGTRKKDKVSEAKDILTKLNQ
jgi:hypothetical protein